MKNALILHGTDMRKAGNQNQSNWFPWLKKELEKRGYKVFLPELPQAWQPNIQRYWNFLQDKASFNTETVLIGHSSGATAILGILEKLPQGIKIKAAILVAGFIKDRSWNCQGLFPHLFDWKRISNAAKEIFVIHSNNDPYVPLTDAQEIATNLHTKVILKPNQGHFNLSASPKFKKFPFLLEIFDKLK